MNFVFISPNFPDSYRYFCMRLRDNGVNVLGLGDCPYQELHPELRDALTEYYRVDSLEDYDQCVRALGYFTGRYGKMDWVESNNEYWLELDAALRTDFNITTGVKSRDISHFKRKSLMKDYYRKAGVPCARFAPVTYLEAGLAFAQEVGYPVIVKPDNGVGAIATYRIENQEEMEQFFQKLPDTPYIMEEYIWGEVTTFDGICNSKGEVLFSASHVTPNSIMDMVNEGVPVYYYVCKDVPPEVRSAGERVLKAFGVKRRFFHLEFFRLTRAKEGLGQVGDIVALEVNMRPSGGFSTDMYNFAASVDVYQIWADMVAYDQVRHTFEGERHYCAYAGRRDQVPFRYSQDQLGRRYAGAMRMLTRMPDALAGTMGNQVCIACFDTLEEVKTFVSDAFAPPAASTSLARRTTSALAPTAKKG